MTFELHIRTDQLNKFKFSCRKMTTAKAHAEKLMIQLSADNASLFNEASHTTKTFANGAWDR
jgi:hypothetical protein